MDYRQTEMLNLWLRNSPDATWGDLITALRAIDEHTVASDIEAPTTMECCCYHSVCIHYCVYNNNYCTIS